MHTLENVVNDAAFWVALLISAGGTAFVWIRLRDGHFEPGIALSAALACLVGLRVEDRLPVPLVVGLALLLFGEWLTREMPVVPRVAGTIPGALTLGAALPDGWPFWIRVVVFVSTVVGGVLVDRADRVAPRLVPLLLAIGAIGVYLCVPDTEAPKALLGALVAAAFVGFAARLQPALGATVLTGLFVWVVGFGGLGRPGSVVGGIACLGAVLLIPLVRSRVHAWVLVVTQCALVLFVSRVAGFEHSVWTAMALCVPAFVMAGLLMLASSRWCRRSDA